MKAVITLTLDPEAAQARLDDLYEEAEAPTVREHFEAYLRDFILDEMNIALWPDFEDADDPRPAVLKHITLSMAGKVVYDADWSFREVAT